MSRVEVSLPVTSAPPPPVPKEEAQCPKSLWDAVHRIRKHTAPDSENEEEEAAESWENPDSVGSDIVDLDLDDDSMFDHEAWTLQEVTSQYWNAAEHQCSTSDRSASASGTVAEGELGSFNLIKPGKGGSKGHSEEDTLSCSSSDSHASRDTVIMGDGEGEGEEGEDRLLETEAEDGIAEDFTTFSDQTESLNEELDVITKTSQSDDNDLDGSNDTDLAGMHETPMLASEKEGSKGSVKIYTTEGVEENRQSEGVTESQATLSSDYDA